MSDQELATAADYADAMLIARRAKKSLVLILLLLMLGQLAVFFYLRYGHLLSPSLAATQPSDARALRVLQYASSGCLFLGIAVSIVLSLVVLLIANIMLVGRLIGVARVTSGYVWTLVLLVLLFPWQAFLNDVHLTSETAPFKVPGVLFTWDEVTDPIAGARFATDDIGIAVLKWSRYVAMPSVAILVLLTIQVKTNRGMRQALGEEVVATTYTEGPNA